MRILAISDVHYSLENLRKIKEKFIHNAGLVLIAGDLTNFGEKKHAEEVLSILEGINIAAIPGNLDTQEVLETLEERNISIHAKKKKIGRHCFIGFGGGMWEKDSGKLLFPENEMAEKVMKLAENETNIVLAVHVPPFNTNLDRKYHAHFGSQTVRKLIEKIQPEIFVCGHIHESFGQERIGKTLCVNAAAAKEGRAAIIETGKKPMVEFVRV